MKEFINALVKNRRPLLAGIALLAVGGLWIGGSLLNLVHNKLEKKRLMHHKVALEQEYIDLQHTLELLKKQDPVLLEKIARTEYDLAKPNEIEFRFRVK
ncbi:MAG: septum formation initiator family protein [Elusimicrobiaceae bacterium]|nr:septum formation initiator family protein [Elusimicrobiaceae bacterium]